MVRATRLKEEGGGSLERVALEHEERRGVADQAEHYETSNETGRNHQRVKPTSGVVRRQRVGRRRQPISVVGVVDVTTVDVATRDVISRHGDDMQTQSQRSRNQCRLIALIHSRYFAAHIGLRGRCRRV